MQPSSSRSDVLQALETLRAAALNIPPSGPNYAAEAARDLAIERMCELPAGDDSFIIDCLEQALAASRGQHDKGYYAVHAAIDALGRRRAMSAAGILGRIVHDESCVAWVRTMVVQILGKWNARAFESIFRSAMVTCHVDSGVRSWSAEMLVSNGLASPGEIDAFLRDPDESVQRLTARGLAALGNADAIVRLTEQALGHRDPKAREQAWLLLCNCHQLAPARGGQC